MAVKKESILEKVEGEVISSAKNYVKRKVVRWTEVSVLVILALIMISFGIAMLIGTYIPALAGGLNYVLFGMVLLIVGILLGM